MREITKSLTNHDQRRLCFNASWAQSLYIITWDMAKRNAPYRGTVPDSAQYHGIYLQRRLNWTNVFVFFLLCYKINWHHRLFPWLMWICKETQLRQHISMINRQSWVKHYIYEHLKLSVIITIFLKVSGAPHLFRAIAQRITLYTLTVHLGLSFFIILIFFMSTAEVVVLQKSKIIKLKNKHDANVPWFGVCWFLVISKFVCQNKRFPEIYKVLTDQITREIYC